MAVHRTSRNPKIDNQAVDGLSGVANSLAYKVEELESHIHNSEDWFGLAAVPDGETHRADDITSATAGAPFVVDAGNDTWGSWLQVLGSGDTPNRAGMVKFDFHEIQIVASEETNAAAFLQISCGETGGVGLTTGDYSTISYLTPTNQAAESASVIKMPRVDVGTKTWARCLAVGENTMTLGFYFGLHEYGGI